MILEPVFYRGVWIFSIWPRMTLFLTQFHRLQGRNLLKSQMWCWNKHEQAVITIFANANSSSTSINVGQSAPAVASASNVEKPEVWWRSGSCQWRKCGWNCSSSFCDDQATWSQRWDVAWSKFVSLHWLILCVSRDPWKRYDHGSWKNPGLQIWL